MSNDPFDWKAFRAAAEQYAQGVQLSADLRQIYEKGLQLEAEAIASAAAEKSERTQRSIEYERFRIEFEEKRAAEKQRLKRFLNIPE